jgi:hypothetical protein
VTGGDARRWRTVARARRPSCRLGRGDEIPALARARSRTVRAIVGIANCDEPCAPENKGRVDRATPGKSSHRSLEGSPRGSKRSICGRQGQSCNRWRRPVTITSKVTSQGDKRHNRRCGDERRLRRERRQTPRRSTPKDRRPALRTSRHWRWINVSLWSLISLPAYCAIRHAERRQIRSPHHAIEACANDILRRLSHWLSVPPAAA